LSERAGAARNHISDIDLSGPSEDLESGRLDGSGCPGQRIQGSVGPECRPLPSPTDGLGPAAGGRILAGSLVSPGRRGPHRRLIRPNRLSPIERHKPGVPHTEADHAAMNARVGENR
jgi:hypothetical protein